MFKVYVQVAIPDRPIDVNKDTHFLCYSDDSPIPWEKKIFVVTDNRERNWFCHEFKQQLTEVELKKVANAISSDYTEKMRRTTMLVVQLVAARANDFDELRNILGKVDLKTI